MQRDIGDVGVEGLRAPARRRARSARRGRAGPRAPGRRCSRSPARRCAGASPARGARSRARHSGCRPPSSRSCWSVSPNACSRSRFWSEITPVALPPLTSGTNRTRPRPLAGHEICSRTARTRLSRFSVSSNGSRVSSTCFANPASGRGSACSRSPRSIDVREVDQPGLPLRRSRSRSPARRRPRGSGRRRHRRSPADRAPPRSASCTLLISASSAFRCRVSCTNRAFSSATLRLPASVSSSCWSDSLNACSRSMFWREITPVATPPTTSGTKSTDFGSSLPSMISLP